MIVSIDHGNKSIKTPTLLFTSGLVESTTKPGIQGDCIFWNGKYYSLTEKRISSSQQACPRPFFTFRSGSDMVTS